MRFLLLAFLVIVAGASVIKADCVANNCSPQLESCINDFACRSSLECSADCAPMDTECLQACSIQATWSEAFQNLTACGAQCIPNAATEVLDLIAEDEADNEYHAQSKCKFLKKAKCAAKVALAISQCKHDIPCIIQKLKSCVPCFCKMIKCKGPCKHHC